MVILITFLLYRNIKTIGKISVFLWAGVIVTIVWIIISGFTHRQVSYSFMPAANDPSMFSVAFALLLGQASVKTIYSYLGYYNVCHLGGEITQPGTKYSPKYFHFYFLYCCFIPADEYQYCKRYTLAGSDEK